VTYWFLAGSCTGLAAVASLAVWLLSRAVSDAVALPLLLCACLCALASFGTGFWFVTANLDRHSCYEQGRKTGRTVEFELLSGCYVRVQGQLIPYDQWVQVTEVKP
jgi:hypothetical protein